MTRADTRPRVHLWQLSKTWQWSLSPTATRNSAPDAGEALNHALAALDRRGRNGVVVIVEASQ
jgi:hypothetical protein